jgi:NAD(P)-dependent dehydrogenase (short-subunit alcohol dehydrogenase family)
MRLDQKVAIVTGSGRDIGRSIALAFAREGAQVTVTGDHFENCNNVAGEIAGLGGKAIVVECDVSSKPAVENMVQKTVAEFGRLDILVNNAGTIGYKPLLDLTESEWDKMINVNLKGQFLCAQAAAREMVRNRSGRIINIASISSGGSHIAFPYLAHYTASKAGVLGLTKALTAELAPFGINVNSIVPGAVRTGITGGQENPQVKAILARIPKGRWAEAEEIANLAVFLAAPESEYITGTEVVIDGGWLTI